MKEQICKQCEKWLVMHSFASTKCEICGDSIITPHKPGYVVCKPCAIEHNKCQQCGEEIKDENR